MILNFPVTLLVIYPQICAHISLPSFFIQLPFHLLQLKPQYFLLWITYVVSSMSNLLAKLLLGSHNFYLLCLSDHYPFVVIYFLWFVCLVHNVGTIISFYLSLSAHVIKIWKKSPETELMQWRGTYWQSEGMLATFIPRSYTTWSAHAIMTACTVSESKQGPTSLL